MEERRSRYAAEIEPPRPRVLSTWTLLGIAALVVIVLVLIFPKRQLQQSLREESGNGRLAASYLRNIVAQEPANAEMRMLLAERQVELGELDEALLTLAPLRASNDEALRTRVLLLVYRLTPTPKRKPLFAELARTPDAPIAMLEAAARDALSLGEYRAASELLFAAQARASTHDEQRRLFMQAVRTLQSGNLLADALAAADRHAGALTNDEATLIFLARLALAANDQARAQTYARKLMKLGAMSHGPLALLLDWLVPPAHAQDVSVRPYDEAIYMLAYDVFVGNRNFIDAQRVAAAAVAQRPNDLAWRERLAQVNEWMGKPADALAQWRYIAERSDSAVAVQGVLRLAPGLNDDEALLAAWHRIAATRALTSDEIRNLAALYERLARPRDGIDYFRMQYARRPDLAYLEMIAQLAERSGRSDEALREYERLIPAGGLTPERALRVATLSFTRGDFRRAYDVLARAQMQVRDGDREFWALFGDLAWRLQQDEAATSAYRRLVRDQASQRVEYERLVQLLRSRYPDEAARLAEAGYERFRTPELLLVALEHYSERRDRIALDRLFARVDAQDEARLRDHPYFYQLRGSHRAQSGQRAQARADYERALALAPRDPQTVAAWLWFLVDTRDPALPRALRRYASMARDSNVLWAPFAAGYMSIGAPRTALTYYKRELREHRDDYLWLLSYADALEAGGDAGMAVRVRRHAWLTARKRPATDARERERMLAYARLVTLHASGDASLAAIRYVLRQDRAVDANRPLDAAAKELVLAWAISTEQQEAAKAWLWRQYGRKLAAPAYAEVSVALAQEDLATLERLLAGNADALPPASRIEAAKLLDRPWLAQSFGFAAMERAPDDDALHEQAESELRQGASGIAMREKFFRYHPLRGNETLVAAPLQIGQHLKLTPFASWIHQSSEDTTVLTGVPGSDREYGIGLTWRYRKSETELALSRRYAVGDFNVLRFAHARELSGGVTARVELMSNERALDTVALLVGGMKDEARAQVYYPFSRREYLSTSAALQNFRTQTRGDLGSGYRVDAELGHRFRIEYPDLTLRAYAAHQGYDVKPTADDAAAQLNPDGTVPAGSFFLPQTFSYYSLNLGFGQFLRGPSFVHDRLRPEPYSRTARPFADVGLSHNTVSGNGYNLLVGIGGSLLGSDFLSLYYLDSKGGTGAGAALREFALRYVYHF